MSTNDRNDPNDARSYVDSEGAPDGELSQDELDNVSGGLRAAAMPGQPDGRFAMQPDGKAMAARPSDDPSDAMAR